MPPQAGMPHALNPKYPDLSKLNIEIPSEPKEFKSVEQRPRRILLNNFDAAVGFASTYKVRASDVADVGFVCQY